MDEEIPGELDRLAKRHLFPLDLRTCRCRAAKKSWVKISQIRTLPVEKIGTKLGWLSPEELEQILSAAAIHGAAHQQPMLFQVVTDRPTRPAQSGRVRIGFHMGRHIEKAPMVEIQTETGTMRVSIPETTAFDLVRFMSAAGHAGNVMTVLSELVEKTEPEGLAALSGLYALPDVQRLGYLLGRFGESRFADPLASWLKARRYRPVLLVPDQAKGHATSDSRWRVIPNEALEVDL